MMQQAKHIGIVAVSAEGAALLGRHDHLQITMHTYPLADYMRHVEANRWDEAGRLLLSSASKLVQAGAQLLICPDNTIHQALDLVRDQSPTPWLHIAEEVAAVAAYEIPDVADRERINTIIFDELVCGRLEPSSRRHFQTGSND